MQQYIWIYGLASFKVHKITPGAFSNLGWLPKPFTELTVNRFGQTTLQQNRTREVRKCDKSITSSSESKTSGPKHELLSLVVRNSFLVLAGVTNGIKGEVFKTFRTGHEWLWNSHCCTAEQHTVLHGRTRECRVRKKIRRDVCETWNISTHG